MGSKPFLFPPTQSIFCMLLLHNTTIHGNNFSFIRENVVIQIRKILKIKLEEDIKNIPNFNSHNNEKC